MCFLQMMSLTESHEVLKACRATLREWFDVINLESDAHIARWYLTHSITFFNRCSQWCRDVSSHMRNRLDVYSIDYKKF